MTFEGTPSTIKFIPQVASKLPNLKIVINHIAKPFQIKFQPWADEMTAAAKHSNVFCKLSGLNDEVKFYDAEELKPYIDHCLGMRSVLKKQQFPCHERHGLHFSALL